MVSAAAGRGMAAVGETLRDRLRVIAPNLLGCGGTGDWPGDMEPSMGRQGALVEAVIDHVAVSWPWPRRSHAARSLGVSGHRCR